MAVEVGAQVGLLLGHRFEQQAFLRREVPVDGAQRDVRGRGNVAHLDGVEAAVGREPQRGVEHATSARRLTPGKRAFGIR